MVRRVVLQEQEIQKSEGVANPCMIEQASYSASYRARLDARERAQNDEAVAIRHQEFCSSMDHDEDTTLRDEDDDIMGWTYFSFFSV